MQSAAGVAGARVPVANFDWGMVPDERRDCRRRDEDMEVRSGPLGRIRAGRASPRVLLGFVAALRLSPRLKLRSLHTRAGKGRFSFLREWGDNVLVLITAAPVKPVRLLEI